VGQAQVADILANGRRYYKPARDRAYHPVEFQIVYRFGHSMVRPSYRANLAGDNSAAFFGMVFDPSQQGRFDPNDLRGGSRAPRRFVGWQTFFDFGDGAVKPNKAIDTKISTPLFNLPLQAIASGDPPTSLPQRNLLRHLTWQMPSGQAIAREMGQPVLSAASLNELRGISPLFVTSTPLWYYVLKEAEVIEGGHQLGPVGGRIVGEVFIGLLQADPASYLNVNPAWQPTVPVRSGNPRDFRMIDFLTFAGSIRRVAGNSETRRAQRARPAQNSDPQVVPSTRASRSRASRVMGASAPSASLKCSSAACSAVRAPAVSPRASRARPSA
jgi:hypothetical protein